MPENDTSASADDVASSVRFASIMFATTLFCAIGAIVSSKEYVGFGSLIMAMAPAYFFMSEVLKLVLDKNADTEKSEAPANPNPIDQP